MLSHRSESFLIGGHPLSGILHGAEYRITGLSGWWERPQVKRNAIPRELSPGSFLSPWSYEDRIIDISGQVDCESHEQMHHIMDQLNGLAATKREWLTVQGHGVTASALIEADGIPVMVPESDRLLSFSLSFRSPDPLKYGELKRINLGYDNTHIGHMGNFPAAPLIRLRCQGMDDGFTVRAVVGGETRIWRYAHPSTGGTLHEINLSTGRHLVGADGIERSSRVTRFDIWDIPPHERIPVRVRPINDIGEFSLAEVIYRDTWI